MRDYHTHYDADAVDLAVTYIANAHYVSLILLSELALQSSGQRRLHQWTNRNLQFLEKN